MLILKNLPHRGAIVLPLPHVEHGSNHMLRADSTQMVCHVDRNAFRGTDFARRHVNVIECIY
jgi:hypothetical protein